MGDISDIRKAERMTDHVATPPNPPPSMFLGYGLAFTFLGAWMIIFPFIQPMWPTLVGGFRWFGFFAAAIGLLLTGNGLGDLWSRR